MRKAKNWFIVVAGIILVALGLFFINIANNSTEFKLAFPSICISIGCGMFGHGMGDIISEWAVRSDPETQRKLKIEKNDERNIAIVNRAKGKAFDMMTFVFGALMVSFALMGIDMIAVRLLVFAYLFVHGVALYYRFKFDKEM